MSLIEISGYVFFVLLLSVSFAIGKVLEDADKARQRPE